jgi:dTDP-4-amino-4,6-dideoxygalactose transaminase
MDAIMTIAEKYNLCVIEDTAQAIGAVYTFQDGSTKSAGCIGDIGTTSFFPSKNLGCYGDGGALFTDNDELAEKLRMICNPGQKVQYVHDIIGVNSRLDTIQAAIFNVKLKYLREYEENRRQAANWYDEALKDVKWLQTPKRVANSTHVFHQYTVKIIGGRKVREMVKNQLNEKGIPTMIYYPIPLHFQKAFSSDYHGIDSFKVSESLCDTVLSLPIHTEMNKANIAYITDSILSIKN